MGTFFNIKISDNRIYGLDILRAIAILFVIFEHGKYFLPLRWGRFHDILIFDGVSFFFVLSGFLIGGILIKQLENNQPSTKLLFNFWIRRWFRTLPNYYLTLLILFGFNILHNNGLEIWSIKSYFVFSQNLFYKHPDFFPEAWSLSVEEWFYIITPLFIFLSIHFLKFSNQKAVLSVALTLIITIIFFRFYKYAHINIQSSFEWDILFRKQVITRLDALMYGVISAYCHHYFKTTWLKYKKKLFFLGLSLLTVVKIEFITSIISHTGFYNCVLSFSVTSLATALLLPFLYEIKSGRGVIYKSITTLSLLSYSMYLLNLSVVQLNIIYAIPWTSLTEKSYIIAISQYGLYWGLTLIGSWIIYKYFEVPTTRLRDKVKF
ncbi:acyltransferase family protein [Flammeovirga aprica]|uniref:Acyltransferase n=1 Tax=Flammeovirga aprica JL-4 TaxID=694437 RepID=A0A7X9S197_9BACT|nr:acyltransferase [Flammeovirga aprica]NME72518.1 acyltransferase [Flammeovirga aprica JL-4]